MGKNIVPIVSVSKCGEILFNSRRDWWEMKDTLPKEVREVILTDSRNYTYEKQDAVQGELGEYRWIIEFNVTTYTLGRGDGITQGSRHYRDYPDGDPRNLGIPEDKSYDRWGWLRNRKIEAQDPHYDGPDEM